MLAPSKLPTTNGAGRGVDTLRPLVGRQECLCKTTACMVKGSSVPARNGLKTLPTFLVGEEEPFTVHATAS